MKPGSSARFGSGWTLSVLSALVLVLVLALPPLAHANSLLDNLTESVSTTNATFTPARSNQAQREDSSKPADDLFLILRSGRNPRDGAETGSGLLDDLPLTTSSPKVAATDAEIEDISPDSAENDGLLPHGATREGPEDATPTKEPWHGDQTEMETRVFDLDVDQRESHLMTTPSATHPPSRSAVFTVGFFDPKTQGRDLDPPSPTPHELQGRDATSWGGLGNYEDITADEVSLASEDETTTTTTEMYDEDPATTSPPPPPRTLRPFFSNPFIPPKKDVDPAAAPPRTVGTSKSGGCQLGLVHVNGTCRSQCDIMPNYCFNGGQCVMLEGTGVFCRCNIQDYVWHKGSRCESVITEFQVMCIAIGSSALTVLLLFMIVVCFAKKLHVLKTENKKLHKRSSKYRPSSEQHNDNFSLSTIAEGSNPNKTMSRYTWETKEEPSTEDDPNAQNKLEDAVKSPPSKEDESLNIQNSLTPKHENHKPLGEENSSEVNSLQNNMM